MIKNLFGIPNTFDPDDRRRRQVLNFLLIIIIITNISLTILTSIYYDVHFSNTPGGVSLIGLLVLGILAFSVLWIANRLPKVPSSVNALVFEVFLLFILSQADSAYELYNGRSLILWAVPIMVSAVILHPNFVFIITAGVFGFMLAFTPSSAGGVNYYALSAMVVIAFISWLTMNMANRAIRDARRQAGNLEAIFNSVADGVLVLDLHGNFSSANPALLKMISEEDLKEIIAQPLEKTVQWKRKIFSVTAAPVPDLGSVAVFRDETRRHEIERGRDALIATASHELRTPLTATMNYLELLVLLSRQGSVDMVEFNQYLARALASCKRLQHLVSDILDQAQIEAGLLDLKSTPFDLRALLAKVRGLFDGLIQQKQLSYEAFIAPDVPAQIVGDPERLQQVFVNLIGNAIKFTKQGGIKVGVAVRQDARLVIEVADTGPGIPEEQLPDIFEAFRRGSDYAQRERQGAGLGLSIAREIVSRMGGEISVISQWGRGSSFTVTLPVEGS